MKATIQHHKCGMLSTFTCTYLVKSGRRTHKYPAKAGYPNTNIPHRWGTKHARKHVKADTQHNKGGMSSTHTWTCTTAEGSVYPLRGVFVKFRHECPSGTHTQKVENGQADRHTKEQTGQQRNRQGDTQTDRQKDTRTNRQTNIP